MKTVKITDKKDLQNNSGLESMELNINASGLVHIMGVLTNLYSTPQTAVLREYVSNAVDSHKKAGVTTPIKITLPTHAYPNLVVRDFGVGMTRDEVVEVYASYGNSTKRDNNDEIGGFGLGAKSALALANRFDVVSIKDGARFEFYIEKNVQGAPKLYFVSETETDESSGVEVTIPYGNYTFKESVVEEFFVGSPSGSLEIDGVLNGKSVYKLNQFHSIVGASGENLGWLKKTAEYTSDNVKVLIGGVAYNLDRYKFLYKPESKTFEALNGFNSIVYVNIPIGTVDLTPSREELIYSDRTMQALSATFEDLKNAGTIHFQAELNRSETRSEAVKTAFRFKAERVWDVESFTWRNQVVPTSWLVPMGVDVVIPGDKGKSNQLAIINTSHVIENKRYLAMEGGTKLAVHRDVAVHSVDIRRIGKSIKSLLNVDEVIIFHSKEDYDNEWFNFAHHSKIRSTLDLLQEVKDLMKENRAQTPRSASSPVVRRPVAYLYDLGNDNATELTVERILNKDERLKTYAGLSKVYYIKEDLSRVVYPFFEFSDVLNNENKVSFAKSNGDHLGFVELARKVAKKTPIFVLNSRSSIAKFKTLFPKAENLVHAVQKYAEVSFTPAYENITFAEVKATTHYSVNNSWSSLFYHYNNIKDFVEAGGTKITNQDFINRVEEIIEVTRVENKENISNEYKFLAHWAGYKNGMDSRRQEIISEMATKITSFVEDYFMLASSPLQKNEKHLSQYVRYVNSF